MTKCLYEARSSQDLLAVLALPLVPWPQANIIMKHHFNFSLPTAFTVHPWGVSAPSVPGQPPRDPKMDELVKVVHGSGDFSFEAVCRAMDAAMKKVKQDA